MRTSNARQQQYASPAEEMGIGPKKTALILFTVVGCIGKSGKKFTSEFDMYDESGIPPSYHPQQFYFPRFSIQC